MEPEPIPAEERREVYEAQLALTPAIPLVADLACEVLGRSWLEKVNQHRSEATSPQPEIRALDEKSALAILAFTPEIAKRIGPEWTDRARRLNAIINTSHHNNQRGTWRAGDAQRALQLSDEIRSFLESRASGSQEPPAPGRPQRSPAAARPDIRPSASKDPATPKESRRQAPGRRDARRTKEVRAIEKAKPRSAASANNPGVPKRTPAAQKLKKTAAERKHLSTVSWPPTGSRQIALDVETKHAELLVRWNPRPGRAEATIRVYDAAGVRIRYIRTPAAGDRQRFRNLAAHPQPLTVLFTIADGNAAPSAHARVQATVRG